MGSDFLVRKRVVGNVTEVTSNNYSLFLVEYEFGILLRDGGRTVNNIAKNIIIGAIYWPLFLLQFR